MSQTQTLTTVQLQAYANQLENGTLNDVEQVYADLYSKGYNYAGWAGGVASESTINGVAAVNFLTGTALMGWGGPQCRNLSSGTVDSIRLGMAEGYVQALLQKSLDNQGSVSADVNYQDTRQFHQTVFENHSLSLDNWTLSTPMELVRQTMGDDVVEALWREIRDTGGDDIDGTLVSIKLSRIVGSFSFSEDPSIRDQALAWIDQVPGFSNFEAIGRMADTVMEWFENTDAGRFWGAINQLADGDPLFVVVPGLTTAFNFSIVNQTRRLFTDARYTSPLILDLDGNGVVSTRGMGEGAYFDHDGNGLAEQSGWVGAGDALLVRDLNGNGRIDGGAELFGNQTELSAGVDAAHGFAALGALDVNADGQVNAQDGSSAWASLKLWKDLNGNGITDDGELIGLGDAGVSSLGVAHTSSSQTDAQGNQHRQLGSFTRSDGSSGAMHDVWFATDAVHHREVDPVEVSAAIEALPDMQGLGNVHSLRQAMARDASGQLQGLVQAFVAGDGSGGPGTKAQVEAILQAWTDADQLSGMRGTMQASKLAVLEAMLAQPYNLPNWNQTFPSEPVHTALLHQAYEALLDDLYDKLMAQTHFKPLYDGLELVIAQDGSLTLGVQAVRVLLQEKYTQSAAGAEQLMAAWGQHLMRQGDFGREVFDALTASGVANGSGFEQALARMGFSHVVGTSGVDVLTAVGTSANLMKGGDGDDTVSGGAAADVLEGGAGTDTLVGGQGHDVLVGGAGADEMRGGEGDDTYMFTRGDGADVIVEYVPPSPNDEGRGGTDTLVLKGGIEVAQARAYRRSNDLLLEFGQGDSVRVVGHYAPNTFGVSASWLERVVFEDGTVWTDWSYVQEGGPEADTLIGGSGSDEIRGGAGNDIIQGLGGLDVLMGEDGDDTIEGSGTLSGGDGNDSLTGTGFFEGGAGDDVFFANGLYTADTYVFNLGDGKDTINDYGYGSFLSGNYAGYNDTLRFGPGITSADVVMHRDGADMVFKINEADQVKVEGWFTSAYQYIERVQFADGTYWNEAQLMARVPATYNGTEDAESFTGWSGVDVINGLGGNDTIQGLGGNDVIDGGAGSDLLIGGAGNDTYVLSRGYDADTVQENDATIGNTDLLRFLEGVATDQIWFQQVSNNLEVSIIGTRDKATITNWYAGNHYKVEQFKTADNQTLLSSQVDALVSAMAAFSPPPPGQTTLTPEQQSALSPVIAANWN